MRAELFELEAIATIEQRIILSAISDQDLANQAGIERRGLVLAHAVWIVILHSLAPAKSRACQAA